MTPAARPPLSTLRFSVRGVCFVEGFLLAVIDGAWQAQRAPSIPEGDRAIAGATKGTGAGPS